MKGGRRMVDDLVVIWKIIEFKRNLKRGTDCRGDMSGIRVWLWKTSGYNCTMK